jgi:predicted DNA-binding protein
MVYGSGVEKTTLYLPRDLQRALREEARRSGRPQAELVRDALRAYLERRERPRARSIGIAADGRLAAGDIEAWLEREWDPR